jgi:hypothetical protein
MLPFFGTALRHPSSETKCGTGSCSTSCSGRRRNRAKATRGGRSPWYTSTTSPRSSECANCSTSWDLISCSGTGLPRRRTGIWSQWSHQGRALSRVSRFRTARCVSPPFHGVKRPFVCISFGASLKNANSRCFLRLLSQAVMLVLIHRPLDALVHCSRLTRLHLRWAWRFHRSGSLLPSCKTTPVASRKQPSPMLKTGSKRSASSTITRCALPHLCPCLRRAPSCICRLFRVDFYLAGGRMCADGAVSKTQLILTLRSCTASTTGPRRRKAIQRRPLPIL